MQKGIFISNMAVALVSAILMMFFAEKGGGWAVMGVVLAVLLAAFVSSMVSSYANRKMEMLADIAARIGQGDLTARVDTLQGLNSKDEFGKLASSIQSMLDKLRTLVAQISDTSEELGQSSRQLEPRVAEVKKGNETVGALMKEIEEAAVQQRNMIRDISQTLSRMARSIGDAALSANDGARQGISASEAVQGGTHDARQTVATIQAVFQRVEQSVSRVEQFNQKSTEINKFSMLITHVAQQTNLLALNASIEAARAGENGRGFAVVAEEIRKLAANTSKSAEQINRVVEELKAESDGALKALREGQAELAKGRAEMERLIANLEHVVQKVRDTAKVIEPISINAQEQLRDAEKIVTSMEEVSTFVSGNERATRIVLTNTGDQTASIEDIAEMAHALNQLARKLEDGVSRFAIR
ncbi:MAG: putative methyl-accepting chemotaxis protein YoaH [Myxococcota bacterium]|nr:putative methyl-accepting chemotaxis protein YoaH [Myxococcota bacterium]